MLQNITTKYSKVPEQTVIFACLGSLLFTCVLNSVSLCVDLGPVLQSIVSLTNTFMANSVTVVAEIFSNTFIFLLQKCE